MIKALTPAAALTRARALCARQERAQQEMRDKLYAWGLRRTDVEGMIARLITEGFLNEQRFAEHYAVSKFRQKGWGRSKIRYGLKQRQVSAPCIALGLKAIEEDEYRTALEKLAAKQWALAKGLREFERERVVMRRLLARGFEAELIKTVLAAR